MLHQIEQRPLGAGRHLHIEAGGGGDRNAEGGRPFVDESQQVREVWSDVQRRMSITVPQATACGFHPLDQPLSTSERQQMLGSLQGDVVAQARHCGDVVESSILVGRK
ncbi:hypothetical protein ACFYOI_23185 [Streptomyces microflavus]|uniref:hypothetical protein n=1 Tax=Streptomyces microflavus TaxID=1919 RepID=UPI0033BD5099